MTIQTVAKDNNQKHKNQVFHLTYLYLERKYNGAEALMTSLICVCRNNFF